MAYTDREDLNYLGQLRLIGQNQTPFYTLIGGRAKTYKAFEFPINQPYELQAASQDTQSEATAAAAGTPVTTTRGQDKNTCQIMKKDVAVSIPKQSTAGEFSGVTIAGEPQPVQDEFEFQKNTQMRQLAIDIEYSFIQGTYVATTKAPAVNQKTRGIIEATSTNAVAAGGAGLSKDIIDQLLRTMWASGAIMTDPIIMVNAFQKQQFSDIYGIAPSSRTVGGLNIGTIETDFGPVDIALNPQMPTDTVEVVELSVCYPVFCPVPAMAGIPAGLMVFVNTAITAAQVGGFWYTQIGLDYGEEKFHGKITGLATS
jgi:hypothetical protein